MDRSSLVFILVIGGLALTVIVANLAETRPFLRSPLHGIFAVIDFIFVVSYVIPRPGSVPAFNPTAAIVALVFGGVALLLLFPGVRQRIAPLFASRQIDPQTGMSVGFNPASMIHMTALILCVYLLASTILSFVEAGGLSGLAQNFNGITTTELAAELGIWLLFATLGVGAISRRSVADTLRRLGLRAPTLTELFMAASTTFFLFAIAFAVNLVWEGTTSQDAFRQQTIYSEKIGRSINTLMFGFVIAATAALGEEIAFRGALQPIFGLWPTAILFAAIHSQYVLTPASLLIVAVGLGLGWLRRKYNTTTAIVAHFLYDFLLIALAVLAQTSGLAVIR